MKVSKSFKGSAVLVVILSAIVFSIYVVSNFAEQKHYGILQDKYEKNIKEKYEKNVDDVEDFYEQVLENNKNNM